MEKDLDEALRSVSISVELHIFLIDCNLQAYVCLLLVVWHYHTFYYTTASSKSGLCHKLLNELVLRVVNETSFADLWPPQLSHSLTSGSTLEDSFAGIWEQEK